jgi:glycosyltransferase involved in cell wall biosynthesis
MKTKISKNILPLSANDICIITPTFNRTKQIDKLLKTLTQQTLPVGSIIVADGMGSAKEVIDKYRDHLSVKWLNCPVQGQITQRNFALKGLPVDCKVVIYFDDDIQLESNAIEEMVKFWNTQANIPAGVSFNISNIPDQPDNIFRHIFCMATEPHGKVWRSGYNSPCGNNEDNMSSEWLPGGVTAWRKDVLDTYSIPDISSRWAVCEDLIFSYPVGKNEPLFFCAKAKVKHIDDITKLGFYKCLERGKNTVLWRLYFVSINQDLSVLLFFWMNIGLLFGYGIRSINGGQDQLGYLVGTLLGMVSSLRLMLFGRNIRDALR